jgi:membrane fusion protein (multidrug efflux system)
MLPPAQLDDNFAIVCVTKSADAEPAYTSDRPALPLGPRARHKRTLVRKRSESVRYFFVILGVLVVVGALVFIKFSQISSLIAFGKSAQAAGPPPESIGTSVAQEQAWEGTLTAVGSVASVNGVSLSTDVSGLVTRIRFESGQVVHEGQVLVELDTSVERAQLASAQERRDLAQTNVGRTRALAAKGSVSQANLDTDESAFKTASIDVDTIRAQIAKKTIRAPFTGRLGIRAVNLGQYLNPGTAIAVLEAIDAVYVDFTMPQQRLAEVPVGLPVRIEVQGAPGAPLDGNIAAVDPTVDQNTRTIRLRASVPNKEERLHPGMFVKVTVLLPKRSSFVVVPGPAVVHAPYGDSVFIVENKAPDAGGVSKTPDGQTVMVARQQFVRAGEARGDFVSVLDGVKSGQEVVSAGAFKLRNGSPVLVNNNAFDAGPPKPELSPHPENH